jgi:predicted protein tyrosine phosphatase
MTLLKYVVIITAIPVSCYSIPTGPSVEVQQSTSALGNFVQHSRPHSNCYWVVPGRILAGEYPAAISSSWYRTMLDSETTKRRLNAYLDAGITFFLDLTEKGELVPYLSHLQEEAHKRNLTIKYQRMEIQDGNIPTQAHMDAIQDTIDKALASNQALYIHCLGGIGRTGTVVGCYLVRRGMTGTGALEQLASWWKDVAKSRVHPRSPQTQQQVEFVKGYSTRALRNKKNSL